MGKEAVFHTSVFIGFMVLAGVFAASAQSISESGPGRISVEAEDVPLAALMKELGNIATLEMVIIAPEVENRPVSLTIKDVPIKEAIQEILEAAGVNHTVWGGNEKPFRIYAGPAEDATRSPPASTATEAPEPPGGATIPPPLPGEEPTAASEPDREEPAPAYPIGGSIQSPVAPFPGETAPAAESPPPAEPQPPGELQPPEESQSPDELQLPDEFRPPEDLSPPEEPQPPDIPPQPPEPPSWFRNATGGARLATGGAVLATDSSLLRNRPEKTQLALTVAILALGLSMGVALVKNTDKTVRLEGNLIADHRSLERKAAFCRQVKEIGGLAVALLLPLSFNPYADHAFEPVKVSVFRWIVGAMALAFVMEQLFVRWRSPKSATLHRQAIEKAPLKTRQLVGSALIYGAACTLATAFSISPRQSFWGATSRHGTMTVLATAAFFLLVSDAFRSREKISRMTAALLLGSVPVAVYAMVQFLGLDPLEWVSDSVSPIFSTMGRSNFLGAYMAMVVPFTLLRWVTDKEGRIGIIAILQIACVLMTQARAALLALTAGASLFFAVLAYRQRSKRNGWVAVAIMITGMALFPVTSHVDLSPPGHSPSFPPPPGMSFAEIRTETVKSRIEIWDGTVSLISKRWLLGYGPDTFVNVYNARFLPDVLEGGSDLMVDDPHNLLLDHLMDVGVVGLIVFLVVVACFYSVTLTNLRDAQHRYDQALPAALLGSVTTYLVQAQFNPDIIVTRVIFWLALGLAVASSRPEAATKPPCVAAPPEPS